LALARRGLLRIRLFCALYFLDQDILLRRRRFGPRDSDAWHHGNLLMARIRSPETAQERPHVPRAPTKRIATEESAVPVAGIALHVSLYPRACAGESSRAAGRLGYAIVDGMNVRDSRVHNYPPRWNAAPSQELLVIRRNHRTGEVSLDPLRWRLIPHWCSDPKRRQSFLRISSRRFSISSGSSSSTRVSSLRASPSTWSISSSLAWIACVSLCSAR
jgi:SOS response associated peptidase (SRAP)